MSNNIKYYIQIALFNLGYIMISGSVIQGVLLQLGISEGVVSFYTSASLVIQVLMMLFASGAIDRMKKPMRVYGISILVQTLLIALLTVFCLWNTAPVSVSFAAICVVSFVTNLFYGMQSILSYKIPYLILDMADYGKITAKSGVILGIVGAAFSALLAFFSEYNYFGAMAAFYLLAGAMIAVSAFITGKYTLLESSDEPKEKFEKINMFKYKPFLVLCIPDLVRGINGGIFLLITVVGIKCKIIEAKDAATIAVLTQVSTIIGCMVYSKIALPKYNGIIVLASSVMFFVLSPLMVLWNEIGIFYLIYFACNFFLTFVNYAVPVLVTQIVDYRCMGQYSAWRMVLHFGGMAVSGVVLTPLLDSLGAMLTLTLSALLQLVSGFVYYIYSKKAGKNYE